MNALLCSWLSYYTGSGFILVCVVMYIRMHSASFPQTAPTEETKELFRGVDLVASKSYSARGVVTIGIWFGGSYYVVLGDGGEEQPLLDSR